VAGVTKIGNLPLRYRLGRRLVQLYLGLVAYGASMAFMLQARLGSMPWDVLHQGIALRTGIRFDWVVIGVGAIVLLLWIPLRQMPGIGTISNVIVVGLAAGWGLALLPVPHPMPVRITFLAFGIVLNAIASGLYIGAALGPGSRDGLMTGLVARTGRSIRLIRTSIEVVVVLTGWALGGTFNIGTILYALAIGPLIQLFLPHFSHSSPHNVPAHSGYEEPHSHKVPAHCGGTEAGEGGEGDAGVSPGGGS
jgi:uncharacterized membrane protein YczE